MYAVLISAKLFKDKRSELFPFTFYHRDHWYMKKKKEKKIKGRKLSNIFLILRLRNHLVLPTIYIYIYILRCNFMQKGKFLPPFNFLIPQLDIEEYEIKSQLQ